MSHDDIEDEDIETGAPQPASDDDRTAESNANTLKMAAFLKETVLLLATATGEGVADNYTAIKFEFGADTMKNCPVRAGELVLYRHGGEAIADMNARLKRTNIRIEAQLDAERQERRRVAEQRDVTQKALDDFQGTVAEQAIELKTLRDALGTIARHSGEGGSDTVRYLIGVALEAVGGR